MGEFEAVVAVENLTKRYGKVRAVEDISFRLAPGTVTGFLGPNGVGKTTTLRMLLGLATPTSGSAVVFGRPYADIHDPLRRVGALLEANDFHPGRRGRDHLRMLALAAQVAVSRVDEVLRLVELDGAARRRVKGYSLGMRQRLALAAALLGEPELLVLDEPANGLDPEGVRWLRDFLRAFAAEGRTVFVSSHVLAEVAQTVDRVVIINKGRLVVESPLSQLTARVAGAALWGALGAGLGAAVRNQVGAIVGLLVWAFLVEGILFALVPSVGRYLPGNAGNALTQIEVPHQLAVLPGALVLIGYAVAAGLAGAALLTRRDVS